MSGTEEDPDLLAAEYVLGTLDKAAAQDITVRALTDPALRAAIAAWEEKLAPLASLATPVTPPASLWRRIAASAGAGVTPSAAPLVRAWRNLVLWRCAAATGFAVAAALAVFVWLRTPSVQPVAALVPTGGAAAAYVAELQPNGTLRLVALRQVSVAAGKDLELWALPVGASRPVPLGLLPATGRSIAPKLPAVNGTQLMVSLEPQGGSPTGLPTGPVLFAGTLHTH